MEIVAVAASIIGAIGEYEKGQQTKRMYDLKAKQVTVESERKAIQYQQQANQITRKLIADNGTLAVRGYAGGVNAFSGSPDTVRAANTTIAGRAFTNALENADAALRGGTIQARIYENAGDAAGRAGMFSAVTKLGMAAASFGGTELLPAEQAAPVVDRSIWSFDA